jgi:hypothetical protein
MIPIRVLNHLIYITIEATKLFNIKFISFTFPDEDREHLYGNIMRNKSFTRTLYNNGFSPLGKHSNDFVYADTKTIRDMVAGYEE